ncbi:ribonuclease E/G [Exiguobacterium sp. SL14]|nr:ribonuclease E/G [Exiguobacterium sp. SL14]MCY1690419.1 ribonuclease E/G [Exiguobacterium sp. SL14]
MRTRHKELMQSPRLEQDEALIVQEAKRLPHVTEALVMTRQEKERLELLGLSVERSLRKGRLPEMEKIDGAIEKAMQRVVWLDGGAYLLIEEVETMTVIDVNSGKTISVKEQKRTFDQINEAVAVEVMRQLRLRNISGMIAIDFLRGSSKGQTRVTQLLKERASTRDKTNRSLWLYENGFMRTDTTTPWKITTGTLAGIRSVDTIKRLSVDRTEVA